LWLIVGLGNPGRNYVRTRHNIGFLVVNEFAKEHGLGFKKKRDYNICRGSVDDRDIVMMEPLTFMNRSGIAVKALKDKHRIPAEKIIVVHDDMDMERGKLKIRKKGSSGGHKGIQSIIDYIHSREFIRIKIGIGRDESVLPEDYVLSRFKRKEIPLLKAAITAAVEAIYCIITENPDKAMNRFN
jgi:PTH1 family peptidyl-tRNA hydrolase